MAEHTTLDLSTRLAFLDTDLRAAVKTPSLRAFHPSSAKVTQQLLEVNFNTK
jgi:hypothetical protein